MKGSLYYNKKNCEPTFLAIGSTVQQNSTEASHSLTHSSMEGIQILL